MLFSKRGFTPFSAKWWVCIGHDVVLVFGFSGVMISMKSIDMYILHDSSLGVCFANRSRITSKRQGAIVVYVALFSPALRKVAGRSRLNFSSREFVDATRGCTPAHLVRFGMVRLLMYICNLAKIRMNYSCHGGYKGIR